MLNTPVTRRRGGNQIPGSDEIRNYASSIGILIVTGILLIFLTFLIFLISLILILILNT